MSTPRIVVAEWCPEPLLARLLPPAHYLYDPSLAMRRPALLAAVREADALVIRNQTQVDVPLLAAAPMLRVLGRLGSGLDNVDVAACQARGIQVVTGRGLNARAVAEYVLAALLHAARRLADLSAETRAGGWNRHTVSHELGAKRLVLVGFGHTGRAVASRALAFGMTVAAYDPRLGPDHPAWNALGVRALDHLEPALASADFLSLHAPLTPATAQIINQATLAQLPAHAYLVNTARGGLIDEAALLSALNREALAGAVLDVRRDEPPPPDDALLRHPRVLSTPHIAGLTAESQEAIGGAVLTEVRSRLLVPVS